MINYSQRQVFLSSNVRKTRLATSSLQTQAQQHIDFPTNKDKESNRRSHTCYKQTINQKTNAKMWQPKLHQFGKWDCIVKIWKKNIMLNVYVKFMWINKNIKDGGSILSMSRGDQLNNSSSCSVFASSQSHLCIQHILQRSIFSSFECYQIIWLSVSRPSLLHPQLPCCAIWCMPSAHL